MQSILPKVPTLNTEVRQELKQCKKDLHSNLIDFSIMCMILVVLALLVFGGKRG